MEIFGGGEEKKNENPGGDFIAVPPEANEGMSNEEFDSVDRRQEIERLQAEIEAIRSNPDSLDLDRVASLQEKLDVLLGEEQRDEPKAA